MVKSNEMFEVPKSPFSIEYNKQWEVETWSTIITELSFQALSTQLSSET